MPASTHAGVPPEVDRPPGRPYTRWFPQSALPAYPEWTMDDERGPEERC
jgi:hypothetical protein